MKVLISIILVVLVGLNTYGETPSGRDKIRLLYDDWEKATGYTYIPRHQKAPDCVGHATAAALDFRMATQALEGPYLAPQYGVDASSIYALSRIEVANTNWPRGSKVKWAMMAISDYGLLYQKNYLYTGYNLTKYDPNLSVQWGVDGLPDTLEQIAKITPVKNYYQVTSYEEVRDAIVAGYPVVVGSNIGFRWQTTRDSDGFLVARGTWKHAQVFIGVDDRSRRKGVCCLNSKGPSWINGPIKLNQPPGSYWIDARTVTRMTKQKDTYAIKHVQSFLRYRL